MGNAVFITGAAKGTGFCSAELFAKNGWDVFLTSRRGEEAEASAKLLSEKYGIISKGYECNIGNEDQIKAIFEDIDKQDTTLKTVVLMAANLGFDPKDPAAGQDFWTVSVEDFRCVFETNLVWNFMIVRQASLRMKETGGGSIVFISSNTAYRAIPNRAAYSASKGGINSFSRALAVDLGQYGIRSNVVLPGTIKTERWYNMNKNKTISGSLTPLGDISDFEDIANAVWYFGTDLSKNVTGSELVVDGGMMSQLTPRR